MSNVARTQAAIEDRLTVGNIVVGAGAALEGATHPVVFGFVFATDVTLLVLLTLFASSLTRTAISAHDLLAAGLGGAAMFAVRARGHLRYDIAALAVLRRQLRGVAIELTLAAAVVGSVLTMLEWPPIRSAPLATLWLLASLFMLGNLRLLLSLIFRHQRVAAHLVRRVAVIGSPASAGRVQSRLGSNGSIRIIGVFDDAKSDAAAPNDIDALVAASRQERLDAIVVALPYERRHEVTSLCLRLRTVLADIYVTPHLLDGTDMVLPETRLGPYVLSVAQRRPLNEWQSLQKAVFDRALAVILLAFAAPALLGLAALIRLDSPGPALFRQTRLGLNNRPFTVFKFRTMRSDQADLHADRQTSRGDPRVTSCGRWMRKLSLDELPQLLNVLRGEMSLVGPRPHALNTRAGGKLLDDALAEYVIRHQIKPGITGWAQVNGARGELNTLEQLRARVMLDLDYMRRWSLFFDIKILVLTVTREIFSRHAY